MLCTPFAFDQALSRLLGVQRAIVVQAIVVQAIVVLDFSELQQTILKLGDTTTDAAHVLTYYAFRRFSTGRKHSKMIPCVSAIVS